MTHKRDILIEVENLRVHFFLDEGVVKAVDGADLTIHRHRTLCVVGESGCGKSVTARSILQLIDSPGRIIEGQIRFHRNAGNTAGGQAHEVVDLASLHPAGRTIRDIRGKDIGMIFQEPMTSLSPIHTIGDQIMESIRLHTPLSKEEAKERTIELLGRVGLPRPAERFNAYPFQFSGGMRQRVMIAMALSCNPSLLIADEPTTAVDVTTQAQILELLLELQEETGMAIVLITHDLGVVAEMADDVAVMYLGQVVETGDVDSIFYDPKHPYTQALLRSIPKLGEAAEGRQRLATIRGMVPDPYNRPTGCQFSTRCDEFMSGRCDRVVPPSIRMDGDRQVRCLIYGGDENGGDENGDDGIRVQ